MSAAALRLAGGSVWSARLPLPLLFVTRTARLTALTLAAVPVLTAARLFAPQALPRLLRRYFEACGATFVKLGQLLAMRYDLLPARYCEELSKLLDRLPPVPVEEIVASIERDLGRPLSDSFADLELEPLASASIAQVHGAHLASGERVVVKVVRPGIAKQFRVDFAYLRLAGRWFGRSRLLGDVDVRALIAELIALAREELDFRHEAQRLHEIRGLMLGDEVDHYAPRVHFELCGQAVITMERIEGVSVREMIAAVESGDEDRLNAWAEVGITPERTARVLMRSILEQTIHHRVFQADPHAANLVVAEGGTLVWLDFGMSGWLDERVWALQLALRQAIASERLDAAYQAFLATLEPLPRGDLSRFEAEIKGYFRDWIAASKSPTATLLEKSSGFFFLRTFDAVRRARARLPLGVLRLYRTILIGDIVMLRLAPQIDWLPVLGSFISRERWRQAEALCGELTTSASLAAALQAAVSSPAMAYGFLRWAHDRLPAMGHTYRAQLSRLERVTQLVLGWTRTAILLGVAALLGSRWLAPRLDAGGWAKLGEAAEPYWWPALLAGALSAYFLGRLLEELEGVD